jgi:hypothetical protein
MGYVGCSVYVQPAIPVNRHATGINEAIQLRRPGKEEITKVLSAA